LDDFLMTPRDNATKKTFALDFPLGGHGDQIHVLIVRLTDA